MPKDEAEQTKVLHALFDALTPQQMDSDGKAYADFLQAQTNVQAGKIGVVGHCYTGQMAVRMAAIMPDRIAAAASFHGGWLATEKPDSPHLLVDRIQGEMYYAFAETDGSVPAHVIPALTAALEAAGTKYELEVCPGTTHGFQFPSRADYAPEQSERVWGKMFALWDRTLR